MSPLHLPKSYQVVPVKRNPSFERSLRELRLMEGRLNERCKPPGWPVTDECVRVHGVGLPCSHFKKTESELQGTEVVKKKEREKEQREEHGPWILGGLVCGTLVARHYSSCEK